MNIATSTLQEEIKKNLNTKSKEKFRIIVMLISSNLFVLLICLSFMTTSKNPPKGPIPPLLLQSGHQWLVIPIQNLMVDKDQKVVSLYTVDKKLLSEKAYIHDLIKTEQGLQYFRFEINVHDIKNFTELSQGGVLVVPYVPNETKKINVSYKKQRGSIYEVDY